MARNKIFNHWTNQIMEQLSRKATCFKVIKMVIEHVCDDGLVTTFSTMLLLA